MNKSKLKVSILGFGGIGREICFNLISSTTDYHINIIDCDTSVSGALEDLRQANQLRKKSRIKFNDFDFLQSSDFIFHTAGIGVCKNQDRSTVLAENEKITRDLFKNRKFHDNCKIIVITNPVDAITYFTWLYSGLNKNQVVGVGTYLDTVRLSYFLTDNSPDLINCILLGEHGSGVVNCKSISTNVSRFSDEQISQAIHQTISAVQTIKKFGDASIFGVSACALEIFNKLQTKSGGLIPVSTSLSVKYQELLECKTSAISLLSLVNETGAIAVSFEKLSLQEIEKIKASAKKVEALIDSVKK